MGVERGDGSGGGGGWRRMGVTIIEGGWMGVTGNSTVPLNDCKLELEVYIFVNLTPRKC